MKIEITDFGKVFYFNYVEYGFALYRYDDNLREIFLANVFVKENSRNKGLGNRILELAVLEAKKLKGEVLILKCDKNSWIHEWYLRKGFKDTSIEKEMVWMCKELY